MILTRYHALFFQKLGKMLQNLSPAAVVICALRVSKAWHYMTADISHVMTSLIVFVEEATALENVFSSKVLVSLKGLRHLFT